MDNDRQFKVFIKALITALVLMMPITILFQCASNKSQKVYQECLDRGGYPISKGPRSYDWYCFKENPLKDRQ